MESSKQDGFILRKNNFNIDPSVFDEVISYKKDLFADIYKLKESLETDFEGAEHLDTEAKNELLDDVCNRIFELVCSHSDRYQIFESYVDFCPAYLEALGKDVEELLHPLGKDAKKAAYYLNLHVYYVIFEACVFSALCAYIELTKRISALSLTEFMYATLTDENLNIDSATHDDLLKSRERKRALQNEQHSNYESFKKWRNRTLSKNRGFCIRKKWYAIPIATAYEQSIVYDILYGPQDKYKYRSYGILNKLYSDILKERNSPIDAVYKDRVNTACEKALRKIKTLKYSDYLEQSKVILSEIEKNKHFRGVTLYKFETANRLYRITSQVNSCLESTTEEEIDNIIGDSYFLSDIPFTNLYNAFIHIDDYEKMHHCVETFTRLRVEFILTTILFLDDLVERGCFGSGDDWYSFFLEVINEKAGKVFYGSDEIVLSIKPEHKRNSQKLFEKILSIPVLDHYIDDDSNKDE